MFNNVKPQGNVCQKMKLQQYCRDLNKGGEFHAAKLVKLLIFRAVLTRSLFLKRHASFKCTFRAI